MFCFSVSCAFVAFCGVVVVFCVCLCFVFCWVRCFLMVCGCLGFVFFLSISRSCLRFSRVEYVCVCFFFSFCVFGVSCCFFCVLFAFCVFFRGVLLLFVFCVFFGFSGEFFFVMFLAFGVFF